MVLVNRQCDLFINHNLPLNSVLLITVRKHPFLFCYLRTYTYLWLTFWVPTKFKKKFHCLIKDTLGLIVLYPVSSLQVYFYDLCVSRNIVVDYNYARQATNLQLTSNISFRD